MGPIVTKTDLEGAVNGNLNMGAISPLMTSDSGHILQPTVRSFKISPSSWKSNQLSKAFTLIIKAGWVTAHPLQHCGSARHDAKQNYRKRCTATHHRNLNDE
jgi:hypothetical protein